MLIMTSNIGSSYILQAAGRDEPWERVEERVRADMHEHFRPEFLNRIDDILVYRPLTREHLDEIVRLQLGRVERTLADREVRLEVTDAARRRIADAGYDPAFGARPLKRAIQRLVTDPLAMAFLEGRFDDGDAIRVDTSPEEDGLTFERRDGAPARAVGGERTGAAANA